MNFNLNPKQFNTLAAGLIIVVALIVYSNSFNVPLQFDDIYHITQKKLTHDLGNFANLNTWKNVNSRPLAMLTLALNYRWGGASPTGYHILNLIFHIISGWLVYLLTLQILSLKNLNLGKRITDNKEIFALLTALLFVVHPIQTQAVTYIIQRITVLASLFYLLGIHYYLKGRVIQIESNSLKKSTGYYVLTLLSFILALYSKQTAVTFPLALLLVELFFIRGNDGKYRKKFFIRFAVLIGLFIVIGIASYGLPRENKDIPRNVYLFTSFRVLVKYIQLTILPVKQNLDYDFKPSESLFSGSVLGSLVLLGGLFYLAYRLFKKNPLVSFGIFWFFLTLLVEQSVIPIRDFIFEHRMYLPSYGLIISALAALFTYLPMMDFRKSKIPSGIVLTIILVFGYGFAAHARNKVWQSDISLWSDVIKKSPGKGRAYLWLGISYSNNNQLKEAKANMDKCIELMPDFPMAYYNRGNINKDLNNYKAALQDYDRALEINPKYMLAYFNRGVVKAKIGQYKEAIKDYDKALKSDPDNTNTLYNRGNSLRNLHKYKESIEDYDKVVKLDPSYTLAIFNRGLSKAGLNEHEEAIRDFDLAIRQDANNHLFYNGKGVSLYSLGRYQEAIANFNNALRVKSNFGQAYYNRGFAKYMGLKDHEGGCSDWQTAASLNYKDARGVLARYCQNQNVNNPQIPQKKNTGKKKPIKKQGRN